jgi:hopanoid-associated phosphorylase
VSEGSLLVVCGIEAEARLFRPFATTVLMSGGNVARLAVALDALPPSPRAALVLSAGVAGGLDPALTAGDAVVATAVTDGEAAYACDPAWSARLAGLTGARTVPLALGQDRVITTPGAKHALFARTGAGVVDMESHVAARWAAARNLPFAVLRVVSDDAGRGLPPSAVAGMGEDGRVRVDRVLAGLLRRPWDLPGLLRTGADVGAAMKALAACAAALSSGLTASGRRSGSDGG